MTVRVLRLPVVGAVRSDTTVGVAVEFVPLSAVLFIDACLPLFGNELVQTESNLVGPRRDCMVCQLGKVMFNDFLVKGIESGCVGRRG